MKCSQCGLDNYDWVSQCGRCRAALESRQAPTLAGFEIRLDLPLRSIEGLITRLHDGEVYSQEGKRLFFPWRLQPDDVVASVVILVARYLLSDEKPSDRGHPIPLRTQAERVLGCWADELADRSKVEISHEANNALIKSLDEFVQRISKAYSKDQSYESLVGALPSACVLPFRLDGVRSAATVAVGIRTCSVDYMDWVQRGMADNDAALEGGSRLLDRWKDLTSKVHKATGNAGIRG